VTCLRGHDRHDLMSCFAVSLLNIDEIVSVNIPCNVGRFKTKELWLRPCWQGIDEALTRIVQCTHTFFSPDLIPLLETTCQYACPEISVASNIQTHWKDRM
jgi:hypothetical protein